MRTSRPPSDDIARREGGGNLVSGDGWSIGDKAFQAPDIERHRDRVRVEFHRFFRAPQERLTFLTIIGEPVVATPGDHSDAVAASLRNIERKLISRCRRALPSMKIRGVHEVDLLAPGACKIGRHKADLLRSLGVDVGEVERGQRILVPHLHCVVDRGRHSLERLAEQIKAEFPGPWRTLAKPLLSHQPLISNLENLSGYCTKMKVAYCDAWGDRTTKFADVYEDDWVETMRATLSIIGLNALYFSHGCPVDPASGTSLTALSKNRAFPGATASSTGNENAQNAQKSLVENVGGNATEQFNVIYAECPRDRAQFQHFQRPVTAFDLADVALRLADSRREIGLMDATFEPNFPKGSDHLPVGLCVDRACHGACAKRAATISLTGISGVVMTRWVKVAVVAGMLSGCGGGLAADEQKFSFRGLSEDTTLEQARSAGLVSNCKPARIYPTDPRELQRMPIGSAPVDPAKTNCSLTDSTFAGVQSLSTFVQFDRGKFGMLQVTVREPDYDTAVRSFKEAFGEPCTLDMTKTKSSERLSDAERRELDPGYGSIPSERTQSRVSDNPRWCFAGGNLLARRYTYQVGQSSFSFPARQEKGGGSPKDI